MQLQSKWLRCQKVQMLTRLRSQFIQRTLHPQPPLVEQHNPIGSVDYFGTMANQNGGLPLPMKQKVIQYLGFTHGVKVRSRFIQNQHWWFGHNCPCYSQPLPLSPRYIRTTFTQHSTIFVRQPTDKFISPCQLTSIHNCFKGDIGAT